jgi:diguanylate cyclase
MDSTLTIVLFGVLAGAVQLAAGIILGRCLPRSEARTKSRDSLEAEHLEKLARRMQDVIAELSGEVGQQQLQIQNASRDLNGVQIDGQPMTDEVLGAVGRVLQINRRLQDRLMAAEERLQEQSEQIETHVNAARTDALTGLLNRRAFDDELLRQIAEWHRHRTSFCLLMVDVDHFKSFNDRYGHLAGDQVLQGLAQVLNTAGRPTDRVARLGGEEFAVLLSGAAAADARHVAERFRAAVADNRFKIDQGSVTVTVSIGLSCIQPGDGPTTLVRRADDALYASKHHGRNCGHFHNGQTCEPITLAAPADPSGDSSPDVLKLPVGDPHLDMAAQDVELQSLVEDLRDRLMELSGPASAGKTRLA